MTMASKLQVLAVNEVRKGQSGDRTWESQDVECVTILDTGEFAQTGRLRLPKDYIGKVVPGRYTGTFALARDESKDGGGRLVARLTALTPIPPAPSGPSAPAPK